MEKVGDSNSMLDVIEEGDNNDDEKQKQELEQIINTVPYSLSIALIKLTILNDYAPMEIEKYYQKILPAFHLLRRNDGSRYQTHSINTVRSAMVSNKLYYKNDEGCYVLNVGNAIKLIKILLNKKKSDPEGKDEATEKISKKGGKAIAEDNMDTLADIYDNLKNGANLDGIIGKKRKLKKINKKKKEGVKNRIEKFEKTFTLLKNLLKVSSNDKGLYAQLNFDFAEMNDSSNIGDKKLNVDKIIGMLSVFKFFKPFLERCFTSIQVQENIMSKISELNSEIYYMDSLFKFED